MDKSRYCAAYGYGSKGAARRAATRRKHGDVEGRDYELFKLGSGRWQWMPLDNGIPMDQLTGTPISLDAEVKPAVPAFTKVDAFRYLRAPEKL